MAVYLEYVRSNLHAHPREETLHVLRKSMHCRGGLNRSTYFTKGTLRQVALPGPALRASPT